MIWQPGNRFGNARGFPKMWSLRPFIPTELLLLETAITRNRWWPFDWRVQRGTSPAQTASPGSSIALLLMFPHRSYMGIRFISCATIRISFPGWNQPAANRVGNRYESQASAIYFLLPLARTGA